MPTPSAWPLFGISACLMRLEKVLLMILLMSGSLKGPFVHPLVYYTIHSLPATASMLLCYVSWAAAHQFCINGLWSIVYSPHDQEIYFACCWGAAVLVLSLQIVSPFQLKTILHPHMYLRFSLGKVMFIYLILFFRQRKSKKDCAKMTTVKERCLDDDDDIS